MGTAPEPDSTTIHLETPKSTLWDPKGPRKLERSNSKCKPTKPLLNVRVGCWNIRKGLIKREQELKNLMQNQELNIMFLVETDTMMIQKSEDYKIEGFITILPKIQNQNDSVRVLCLVQEEMKEEIKIREDLMSDRFPSIWVELDRKNEKNVIIGGFYREWTRNGESSYEKQMENLRIITEQFEKVTEEEKGVIILGDANLCTMKWEDPDYKHLNMATELRGTLSQCGLVNMKMGYTYLADRLSAEGKTIESALDHIYVSQDLEKKIKTRKLEESSTDHLPIIAELENGPEKKKKPRIIVRRSMKNFTQKKWTECLAMKRWEIIGKTEDVEEMAKFFNKAVVEALDECAPFKRVTIKQGYKSGLSQETKDLIKERDKARKAVQKSPDEKKVLHEKYKRLRNRTTNQIRKETIQNNGERIQKAGDENEVWKIVNEITNPREEKKWSLIENGETLEDEEKIAEVFNVFFVEKIASLKENIDKNLVREPLEKLKKKMEQRNLKFSLKTVSEKKVRKAMDAMKKKKSAGLDGISQENLLLGKEVLVIPLTRIINSSISTGIFPKEWKEAVISPILKKGDPTDKKNYRPVSCLAVASKVLEKIVCDQVTRFMEMHDLLPNNQHGFREKRSTMTALSAMQQNWAENTEENMKTGILFWDLSAAYDTLDIELLCDKLKLYGFDQLSWQWFESFLTNRKQRVKIGKAMSKPVELTSGVPQGGILSPIIFTIYGADLEEWVKHSKIFNYADDTSSSCKDKEENVVIEKLQEDAEGILQFMASNGLVANPAKTDFMMLNQGKKDEETKLKIKVGQSEVEQSKSSKLLGIVMDDDQKWKSHFKGKNGLISSLNHRLFLIRRIEKQIPEENLKKVVDSLWNSKLRYGLQLCTQVRMTDEDKKSQNLKLTQIAQNKMLRLLDKSRIRDKRSIKEMLTRFDMLSVNQTAAQIKLTEAWKAVNEPKYPLKMRREEREGEHSRTVRTNTRRELEEGGKSRALRECFSREAGKIWNRAPADIKEAKTLRGAKKAIRKFCKSLPT